MSTQVYELLHRLLFVLHAFGAAFVAGATLWLSALGVRGLFVRPGDDPIAASLRDWLPFVLGLAITFGVGPLLFVQLSDGRAFYTANLLLSHRFMAVLPALIVGFYLLYVQKTDWRWVRSRTGRAVVPSMAFACFGFTAFSWSQNHLLAQTRDAWPTFYAAGPSFFAHADLAGRLTVFAGAGLLAVAALAATSAKLVAEPRVVDRLSRVWIGGVVLVAVGLGVHPVVPIDAFWMRYGGILAALAVGSVLLWVAVGRGRASARAGLIGVALLVLERLAALREAIRAGRGGGAELAENASAQGFAVFAAALVAVVVAIAWAIVRVRADLRAT